MSGKIWITLAMLPLAAVTFADNECKVSRETKVGDSAAKYTFQYASGAGTGCRLYKLKNKPGGVRTPVNWGDGKETFVQCQIPRAAPGDPPQDWIERERISDDAAKAKTKLGYGINYDEQKEEPIGFVEAPPAKKEKDKTKELPPLVTRISGTFADNDNRTYKISVRVSSSVKTIEERKTITYEIAVGKGSRPVMIPDSRQPRPTSELKLDWQSAASEPFFAKVRESATPILAEGKTLRIEIPGHVVAIRKSTLVISYGQEPIVTTTAPAYVVVK